ncbi:MAG: hypothetical protein CALGDGBN_01910 [Pseudomonadales bacterium]|nr:hypothetical protein [Pseudomonadales bacterium]
MARVALVRGEADRDPVIAEIFDWVTRMEGAVPNHFLLELNFPEYFKAKLGSTRVLWEQGELQLDEIQHIGILVSRANGCPYCTAAFCTILNQGLQTPESYVEELVANGVDALDEGRLKSLLAFALKVNADPKSVVDADIDALHSLGLGDRGVVQLVHLVSDFGSYNRLNLALATDYDYREIWRSLAAGVKAGSDPSAR